MFNKFIILMLFFCLLLLPNQVLSSGMGSATPPPVKITNFTKGFYGHENTFSYFSFGDFSGIGLGHSKFKSKDEKNGFNYSWYGILGGSSVSNNGNGLIFLYYQDHANWKTTEDKTNMWAINLNANWIHELVDGEKRNVAGEIIKKSFSAAVFAGLGCMYFNSKIEHEEEWETNDVRYTNNYSNKFSDFSISGQVGITAKCPLGNKIEFVPYAYAMYFSEAEDIYPTYGFDLNIFPYRNDMSRYWSLGTVISQIESNQDDMTLITLQYVKEFGKTWSNEQFGPKMN